MKKSIALLAEVEQAVTDLVEDDTYAEIASRYPTIVNNLLFLND